MKEGDIVRYECINEKDGMHWFWKIKPPFEQFKIFAYWLIKKLKP